MIEEAWAKKPFWESPRAIGFEREGNRCLPKDQGDTGHGCEGLPRAALMGGAKGGRSGRVLTHRRWMRFAAFSFYDHSVRKLKEGETGDRPPAHTRTQCPWMNPLQLCRPTWRVENPVRRKWQSRTESEGGRGGKGNRGRAATGALLVRGGGWEIGFGGCGGPTEGRPVRGAKRSHWGLDLRPSTMEDVLTNDRAIRRRPEQRPAEGRTVGGQCQ